MTPDMALVIGLILAGLAVPSMLSAFSDKRAPRASALTILIAGGLLLFAIKTQPGGYTLQDIPNAFVRVIGQIL
ncbi:MAG: hypothetical protein ABJQ34_00530 [Paracoccaceae bacterium]